MKAMLRVIFLLLLAFPMVSRAQCPESDLQDVEICAGSSIRIDAENPGSDYEWSTGETSRRIDISSPGLYTVTITRDLCTISDDFWVYEKPAITADFTPVVPNACQPNEVEFMEDAKSCASTINKWTWDFGDGSPQSNQRNPQHAFPRAGDYDVSLYVESEDGNSFQQTITVTIDNAPILALGPDITLCQDSSVTLSTGLPDYESGTVWSTGAATESIMVSAAGDYSVAVDIGGCTLHDTVKVRVVPPLQAAFTNATVSNCAPVTVKFTDASTAACGGPITGWNWDFGDGTASNQRNPQHAFPGAADYIVRLTVTNAQGGSSSTPKRITINPSNISVNLGADTAICAGSSVRLNATQPGATYAWSTGATTPSIDVSLTGQYRVSVSANGCTVKDTINVRTTTPVIADWAYEQTSTCLPVDVSFTDSSKVVCGGGITGWRWDFGDGDNSTQQNPVHEYASAGSYTVRLTVSMAGGGTVTKSSRINVTNARFTVTLPDTLRVCEGGPVMLDPLVEPSEPSATFSWAPGNGLSDASIRNPVLTPNGSRRYTLTVTQCRTSVSANMLVITDTLAPPRIVQQGNTLRTSDADKWQWYRDGELIEGANTLSLRADRQGYYTVQAFKGSGCVLESDQYFFTPVSGKESPGEKVRVKATPNPTSGLITIVISDIPQKPARITVYDAKGRKFYTGQAQQNVNPLRGLRLAKGLYFVEVLVNDQRDIISVVVQ